MTNTKTYKETKEAVKNLILQVSIKGVYNYHFNALNKEGHTYDNLRNAYNYFQYSPKAAKYR